MLEDIISIIISYCDLQLIRNVGVALRNSTSLFHKEFERRGQILIDYVNKRTITYTDDGEIIHLGDNRFMKIDEVNCTISMMKKDNNNLVPHGRSTYYGHGTILEETHFKDGVKHGLYRIWDRVNKSIFDSVTSDLLLYAVYEEEFVNGISRKVTMHIRTSPTLKETRVLVVSNGYSVTHGYTNGVLHSVRRTVNDRLHGIQEYFHLNGTTSASLSYKNGKKDGLCMWMAKNGHVYRREFYINGVIS